MLDSNQPSVPRRDPWNKGRLIGQKRPLKPKDVWSIRGRLQVERRARNLALFNLAIDSKLRGCDLVRLQVDLPPKKWTGLGRHTLSERWADVAQGRMQAAGIVEALDILEEVSAGLGAGAINPMVNPLGLEAVKEALHWRVVLIIHLPHGSKA